jgi:hypothetical protein
MCTRSQQGLWKISWLRSPFRCLKNPPFLPDLDQTTFLLFPKIKNKLAGISIIQESLKGTWEGVVRFLKKDYVHHQGFPEEAGEIWKMDLQ